MLSPLTIPILFLACEIFSLIRRVKVQQSKAQISSIMTKLSKLHEKLMYIRLSKYFDSLYFSSQWRFRKGFSLQHCLLVMLENLEKAKGRRNDIAALLTSFFRFWLRSSQSSNWKALLLWSFPRCSADNFFSSKGEWDLPKLITALVLDQILNMDFSCLFYIQFWIYYF